MYPALRSWLRVGRALLMDMLVLEWCKLDNLSAACSSMSFMSYLKPWFLCNLFFSRPNAELVHWRRWWISSSIPSLLSKNSWWLFLWHSMQMSLIANPNCPSVARLVSIIEHCYDCIICGVHWYQRLFPDVNDEVMDPWLRLFTAEF